jgi:uncharacterized membrane protein
MLYEPWVESARNYDEIRNRLKSKGFTEVSMGYNPLLKMEAYSKAPIADTSTCRIQRTMIRKQKTQ